MSHAVPPLNFWESTDRVFVLDLGQPQRTLTEDEATELFHALGTFLKQPVATLGVDEYSVLEQWRNLKEKGMVKGSMDLEQAREAFWVAMEGFFFDTTKPIEQIDAYLIDLAERHQGSP